MPKPLTFYLPYSGAEHTLRTIEQLRQSPLVERVCLLSTAAVAKTVKGCDRLAISSLYGSQTMQAVAKKTTTPYAVLVIHDTTIEFGQFCLDVVVVRVDRLRSGLFGLLRHPGRKAGLASGDRIPAGQRPGRFQLRVSALVRQQSPQDGG